MLLHLTQCPRVHGVCLRHKGSENVRPVSVSRDENMLDWLVSILVSLLTKRCQRYTLWWTNLTKHLYICGVSFSQFSLPLVFQTVSRLIATVCGLRLQSTYQWHSADWQVIIQRSRPGAGEEFMLAKDSAAEIVPDRPRKGDFLQITLLLLVNNTKDGWAMSLNCILQVP